MSSLASETVTAPEFPVADYQNDNVRQRIVQYPGKRPDDSFVTDGHSVSPLVVSGSGQSLTIDVFSVSGEVPIDDYLDSRHAPRMDSRIPLLAYGANLNPASLKRKYDKAERANMQVIPTTYGWLEGHDVVWSGGPGVNGNFTACLYGGEETAGTAVRVGVNFLTREQMLVMHATELNYKLARTAVSLAGIEMPVYYYEGRDNMYARQGSPVAIAGIAARDRVFEELSGEEMLREFLAQDDVLAAIKEKSDDFPAGRPEPDDLVKYVLSMKKSAEIEKPRVAFKWMVQAILAQQGLVRTTGTDTDIFESWANPSVLQTFGEWQDGRNPSQIHVLPSTELSRDSWSAESRKKVLSGQIEHFHRHLAREME